MIGRTCTDANVDLTKVRAMYHQRYMKEAHKDPEVVPTVNPKNPPNTFETVDDYIIGFRGVYGNPPSYGFRDYLIDPVNASDPTYHANDSDYFTNDEEIITQ